MQSEGNPTSSNQPNKKRKPKLDPEFLPLNKHAPTPLEQQRTQVAKLLQDPTREIQLPKPPRDKSLRPPREMMKNVQGSSAGAGSGEFHVYKQSRRREYERLRLMDENEQKEKERLEFESKQAQLKEQSESKTNKNRAKRQKRKERQKKKGKTDINKVEQTNDHTDNSETEGEEEEDLSKKRKLGAAPIAENITFRQPNESEDDDEEKINSKITQDESLLKSSVLDSNDPTPIVQPMGLTIIED